MQHEDGVSADGDLLVRSIFHLLLIYQSGVKEVYYDIEYRNDEGIKFLKKCGVEVKKL